MQSHRLISSAASLVVIFLLLAIVVIPLQTSAAPTAQEESPLADRTWVRLGGPTRYAEGMKEKPWLGRGVSEATPAHIRKTMTLVRATSWVVVLTVVLFTLL